MVVECVYPNPLRQSYSHRLLGQTKGFGRNAGRYYHHGRPKTVLVRGLRRDARVLLSAPFLSPILQGKEEAILDLNAVNMGGCTDAGYR